MKMSNEFDPKRLERIRGEADRYLEQMLAAHNAGGKFEDFVEPAGVEALKKITALADAVPQANRIVPTVTEVEGGRERAYDLYSLLMKHRIVLLEGQVEDSMASVAVASLLYLEKTAPGENINVHINSPGGSVIAGLAIYDTMRSISSPVTTIGTGMQASMGSILLAAGDTRRMTRSSKLMIHSISSGTEGKLSAQEVSLEETRRLFDEMKAIYTRHIGLTPEFWHLTCAHDTWLTADQALKMGFIDDVIVGDRKPAPYEKSAEAFVRAAQDKREAEVPKTSREIKELLMATSSDDGKGERLRAELIVALAQMPEFWTAEKKALVAEKAAKAAAAAAAPANDDKPTIVTRPAAAPADKGPKFGAGL